MKSDAMKHIDNSGNYKMISQGNTAEIFLYDHNKILKLFREEMPPASIHSKIHKTTIDTPYTVKEKLSADIDTATELSVYEKGQIKKYMDTLPDGIALCHFDFHPGNVMIQGNTPIIIDWMTACTGSPSADVARTCILLQFGELQHANFFRKVLTQLFKKYIGKVYYEEYKRISGISGNDMDAWILPVAAARLTEWITDHERTKLVKLVKYKLASIQE